MTIELALGIVLASALVILVLLAARQEKVDNQMVEETHQKIKAGLQETPTPVEKAAEKVLEEAVAPAPVVVEETPVVVEVVEVAVEAPKVEEEVVVKPKKKRKYKPRNPQNKK
jgi:hypothetical protein